MNIKKILSWIVAPIAFFGVLTGAIIYKSVNPYKPAIYNYQSYVNPDMIPKIQKNYSYKEYKNNSEFNNAIDNNKAVGGISTDYMLVDLINSQKISKIPFKEAFEITDPKAFYSDQTIKQLDFFDKFLGVDSEIKGDVDGDGLIDHFYEYLIPIWLNNKVFMYNSNKIDHKIPDFNNDFSYINILKELSNKGVDVWSWTNAAIENSVIGSEISNDHTFNTELTNENYVQRIDEFAQIVERGTGFTMNNTKVNIFEDDSDIVLQSTIDSKSSIKGSYLFNGDALDAYWSEDNFSNVPNGTIKIVKPKHSPSFIDGFVVSSSISEENQVKLLKEMNEVFFRGKFMTKEEISAEIVTNEGIDWNMLPSLSNFDYVNYTPTSKGEYDFILENYFQDEDEPEVVKSFYEIKANSIVPIHPLNEELQSKIVIEFKRRLRL